MELGADVATVNGAGRTPAQLATTDAARDILGAPTGRQAPAAAAAAAAAGAGAGSVSHDTGGGDGQGNSSSGRPIGGGHRTVPSVPSYASLSLGIASLPPDAPPPERAAAAPASPSAAGGRGRGAPLRGAPPLPLGSPSGRLGPAPLPPIRPGSGSGGSRPGSSGGSGDEGGAGVGVGRRAYGGENPGPSPLRRPGSANAKFLAKYSLDRLNLFAPTARS